MYWENLGVDGGCGLHLSATVYVSVVGLFEGGKEAPGSI
jgi:hypothetical protein